MSVFTIVIIFIALVREGSESHNYIFSAQLLLLPKDRAANGQKQDFSIQSKKTR